MARPSQKKVHRAQRPETPQAMWRQRVSIRWQASDRKKPVVRAKERGKRGQPTESMNIAAGNAAASDLRRTGLTPAARGWPSAIHPGVPGPVEALADRTLTEGFQGGVLAHLD